MSFDPERVTLFARTDARGKDMPFGIKAKDRTKHMYVIGKTGMGKSTMLENMAVQDIQNGEGMAFMDPHGASAEKILEYIPEHRIKDVLYFAPFDMEHPMSFNVMEDVGYDKRHLVVSGLMSTFKKIWVDAWSARMEYILSNTMLALLEFPGATLLGVNRMLSDKDYRDMVVTNVKDPAVRSFWVDEFAKYNERYMQEAGDAIKNKIGQFTANPLIRNIIGQEKSSFDVRQMMDDRKILIINLSKGLVGETNANLLGSMFITRIYLAAMSRADLSPAAMAKAPNFYLYVDEFQSFANETFASILSEARKYKLNLTIAHQYVEQMEEEVRDAVFGNVGTTISFRVGPFDAETLEVVFAPQFTATDLVNLGFAQIYLSLMIDGIGSKPFSAVTLPPISHAEISHADQVIAASRARFARPRAEVEELIRIWHEPVKKREKKENVVAHGGEDRARIGIPKQEVVLRANYAEKERAVTSSSSSRVAPAPVHRPPIEVQRVPEEPPVAQATPAPVPKSVRTFDRAPQKQPIKNLEDLRSVLQRISKKEIKSEEKPPRSDEEKIKKEKIVVPQENTTALADALRTIVPESTHAKIPVSETHKPEQGMTRAQLEDMLKVSKHDRPPV